jgi:hypothetical protein
VETPEAGVKGARGSQASLEEVEDKDSDTDEETDTFHTEVFNWFTENPGLQPVALEHLCALIADKWPLWDPNDCDVRHIINKAQVEARSNTSANKE